MAGWRFLKGMLEKTFNINTSTRNLGVDLNSDNIGLAKTSDIVDLRDSLKPTRGTVTQALSSTVIAAAGTQNIDLSGLNGYSAIIVIVKATFDIAATAGVRVRWLYSPDGTNFDSPEEVEVQGNYEDIGYDSAGNFVAAGGTRQRTLLVPIFTDNIRVQIVNLDSSVGVTVDAWYLTIR